jgi:hypothetical protein
VVNPVYSAPDIAKIRSRYRARDMVYFDPQPVVFQALVASVPSATEGTYLQIEYDTVSVGAYTDIREGMMLVISETSDHTDNLYELRISDTPSSSILYVNEAAFVLEENQYITVIDTYKALQRVRKGALVDGILPYEGLPATINNLPSALVIETSGTGQFVLNPSLQTLDGSTVSSTLYEIPGATYDVGGTSTLASTITMPADSHTWGRLSYVLSSGVEGFMVFQLIVQDPLNPTIAAANIKQLRLNRTWPGHHANFRAEAGVPISSVMNGTRAVIVSRRRYDGGTLAGAMDNVAFVGYLSKEANSTQSIDDKSVTFDLVGIWERAGQLPFNPIAVRDVASPAKWDEMDLPTTQRVVAHVLARYSTILNLCSLDLDLTDGTWYGGDMDVNTSSLGDALKQVLSEINAEVIQNPSGELFLRRDLRYEDDATRDAADIVWTLTSADLRSLDLQMRHDEQTGRIIIGFRGYQTSRVPSKGGKGVAPAVTLGTSPETRTRNNQLMPADLTDTQLIAAAKQRSGDVLAAENPPFEMSAGVYPYLSWLNTSCSQWVNVDIAASLTTRGRALDVRVLLESIEISYDNTIGSHDLTLSILPETKGGAALIVAALTPNVSGLSMFVLPPSPAYSGSYGGPSTLNSTDDQGPAFGGHNTGGGNPVPGDQAWEDAENAPEPGKKKFAISFANSANVAAGFTSTLGATYTITAAGSARINEPFPTCTNLKATQSFYTGNPDSNYAEYFPGSGLGGAPYEPPTGDSQFSWRLPPAAIPGEVESVEYFFSEPIADFRMFANGDTYTHAPAVASLLVDATLAPLMFPFDLSFGFGFTTVTNIAPESFRVERICFRYTAEPLYADSFYQWNKNEEGNETNMSALGALAGLFIDNAVAATAAGPNPDHRYTFDWTGSGGIPDFKFQDPSANWDDNQNLSIHITIEGEGVDT